MLLRWPSLKRSSGVRLPLTRTWELNFGYSSNEGVVKGVDLLLSLRVSAR
jgi:hypothetical protein